MYLWEEIHTKFQMYPFHPPRCSATQKFLARLDVHLTFVWVLTAVDVCIPKLHCIPWCFLNCSFTQCDDLWISLYRWRWPTFKFQSLIQNSFQTYITLLYPFLCPGTWYQLSSFWCSEWCGRIHFRVGGVWNLFMSEILQERIWLIVLSPPLYLFSFLSWGCTFLVMVIVALTTSIPPVP